MQKLTTENEKLRDRVAEMNMQASEKNTGQLHQINEGKQQQDTGTQKQYQKVLHRGRASDHLLTTCIRFIYYALKSNYLILLPCQTVSASMIKWLDTSFMKPNPGTF